VALTVQNLPPHNHAALCGVKGGNRNSPAGGYWSTDPGGSTASYNTAANGTMSQTALTSAGSSVAHDNMQPYLCVNFIISLFGVFPSPT
jgi:microcystin-dependent protein